MLCVIIAFNDVLEVDSSIIISRFALPSNVDAPICTSFVAAMSNRQNRSPLQISLAELSSALLLKTGLKTGVKSG